jgi:hypothetical protein
MSIPEYALATILLGCAFFAFKYRNAWMREKKMAKTREEFYQ